MTELSLAEWLRQLEQRHPTEIDLGLTRVRAVANTLGLTEPAARTVVVAGTNGKGSVVALLEAGLLAKGQSVGAFTSPHLVDYNERIRIAGESVADADIVAAFAAIDAACGDTSLTYFEFGTLAALWLFRAKNVDWQLLEVGLGGRLDAVNIIDAELSLVTSIGLDHQEWLGPDREHIAIEKAHVARAAAPCVVLDPAPPATLLPELESLGAEVVLVNRDYHVRASQLQSRAGCSVPLPAPEGLLPANIAGALQALELLGFDPADTELLDALAAVRVPGRRQVLLHAGVELVLDVAHNREAAVALDEWLGENPCAGRTYGIYASLGDKPFHAILQLLDGRVHRWYLPRFNAVGRSANPDEFGRDSLTAPSSVCEDFNTAWQQVWSVAEPGDRVLIFGSFVTVGAALNLLAPSGVTA